jgi:hypothetical protein
MSAVRLRSLSLVLITLAAVLPALAGTTRIDDSATLPYAAPLTVHWEQTSPRPPLNNLMSGTLTLRVKLNVAPWLKRTGRIYLTLPAQQPGPMYVSWMTQGHLLPGQLTSGGRTLVYSGPITTPFIEDTLQLSLRVDGTRLQEQLYHVNFNFEMDQ